MVAARGKRWEGHALRAWHGYRLLKKIDTCNESSHICGHNAQVLITFFTFVSIHIWVILVSLELYNTSITFLLRNKGTLGGETRLFGLL